MALENNKKGMRDSKYKKFFVLYKKNHRGDFLRRNFPWLYRLLKKIKR
jgi:hypothetical protein